MCVCVYLRLLLKSALSLSSSLSPPEVVTLSFTLLLNILTLTPYTPYHSYLHQQHLVPPLLVLLQELFKREQLLRDALDHVEAVNTKHDLVYICVIVMRCEGGQKGVIVTC